MSTRLIPAVLFALAIAFNPAYALKFIGYGDTRDNPSCQATQATLMEAEGPEAIINTGDIAGSYSTSSFNAWKATLTAKPGLNALVTGGKVAIALGNHDGSFSNIQGSGMVKGSSKEYYSWKQGNCFFVCMGYLSSSNYPWLRTQLNSDSAKAAKWRFIFQHKPIYSSFDGHGGDGTTSEGTSVTLERQYCDTFKVTAFFSGHDHGYERSKLMHHNTVAATTSPYNLQTTPGTIYMMNGSGGAPFYAPASTAPSWRSYAQATYGICTVNATTDTCYFKFKNNSGTVLDSWIMFDKTTVGTVPAGTESAALPKQTITLSSSCLNYTVPQNGKVLLKLYNVKGELLATLIDKSMDAGSYSLQISQTAGIYVCALSVNGTTVSRKISLR